MNVLADERAPCRRESPFLSELSYHWRNSFEGCLDAGVFKGWKVRNVKGLSEHARGYGYQIPPNIWGSGEEIVFELHRGEGVKPAKKGQPATVWRSCLSFSICFLVALIYLFSCFFIASSVC